MPLSEHEQRQLEQIEQALYSQDPKFVHAVRSSDPRVHYKRRAVQAVAGFVVMLVCSMWALTSYRHISATSARTGFGRPRSSARTRRRQQRQQRKAGVRVATPGMMERLEERWRRRQEGG